MTATNHALTGAVVALVVKKPELAIPLAFLSHFVLDAIPHFGIDTGDVFKRNHTKLFKTVLVADILVVTCLFFIVMFITKDKLSPWITATCMFVATSPDLVWGVRFYKEVKTKIYKPPQELFSKFHLAIQWSETPAGAITEFLWFIGTISLIIVQK